MVQERKLVEDVSGWLQVYDDGSVVRTWTGPPEIKFVTEPVPPHDEFVDGVATKDVVTDESSGKRVRIYLPEKDLEDDDKLPILLHFHGGGFCISQTDWFMYHNFYSRLTRTARVVCVSVYLRLAPENRLPAAIDDAFAGLLWLQSVSKGDSHEPWLENHGDFNRVFLIGDSSGGNVVHQVAARAGNVELNTLKLAGGIPIHPGFVRSERSKSELEKPESTMLTLEMMDKLLSLGLPVGSNKDHPITCPMGAGAPPLHGLNLPAFLVCLAEMDLMLDTQTEYYEAMKKANKEVELFMNEGMPHSFYLNAVAMENDTSVAAHADNLIYKIKEFIASQTLNSS
ncbi:hypothetical protein L6164_007123 [Bauhinia variegata]|uniref:Uncharacterized protein n=1 Tax=Bauhinia variegata TaxID=167791 RepID=A0ACB9PWJ4_BAUVA|nr:hypothetical protein L6164_007123 [Bauhinia variegata]